MICFVFACLMVVSTPYALLITLIGICFLEERKYFSVFSLMCFLISMGLNLCGVLELIYRIRESGWRAGGWALFFFSPVFIWGYVLWRAMPKSTAESRRAQPEQPGANTDKETKKDAEAGP